MFVSLLFSFPQDEDRLEASIRVIVSVVCTTKEEKERESTVKVNFGFLQLSYIQEALRNAGKVEFAPKVY